jgi:HK97 gp10 family phage protein
MGKEIRAKLTISPESLSRFKAALSQLREVTREAIVKEALLAGGEVVHDAVERRAPGPHIEVEFAKGSQLNTGRATGDMKKEIRSSGLYVVVGPDKEHWHYRFSEFGSSEHGVSKRKRTRFKQYASRHNISASALRTYKNGKARKAGNLKPVMSWMQGGKRIFARKVRGMAAKPFMRPGVDESEKETMQAIMQVLIREIKKASKE